MEVEVVEIEEEGEREGGGEEEKGILDARCCKGSRNDGHFSNLARRKNTVGVGKLGKTRNQQTHIEMLKL